MAAGKKDSKVPLRDTFFRNASYLRKEHMKTTVTIEVKLLDKAAKLTGIREKTSLVRLGLEVLIARESGKRLAKLGGTEKKLKMVPRRRLRDT